MYDYVNPQIRNRNKSLSQRKFIFGLMYLKLSVNKHDVQIHHKCDSLTHLTMFYVMYEKR